MTNKDFIIVPRQITVGTSFGTYSTISSEAMKKKYHGANIIESGERNLNPAKGKIIEHFVKKDSDMDCILYEGYSDESKSIIFINNRRGERVTYKGAEDTPGSYERNMTKLDVIYLKPDGTFGRQQAVDKNNNGVVDEGEIFDFYW